ncbi:MAG: hydroxyquinol 1,2-dioxygenase [SAR324 cluster bacterium]|nr:hydroxyquinol 1,2-dioxygenase [SAR324 cluster bacterium]
MKNLTADNMTEAVLKSAEGTENPRAKEIMSSLIRHLHEFVREVRLTQEEWQIGLDYLYEAGQISNPERQEFILTSDTLGISSLVDIINNVRDGATPSSVLGPFYIENSRKVEIGASLIGQSEGTPTIVSGKVWNIAGEPVQGALVDVWHNADNRLYEGQDPEQPENNLRCQMLTNRDGYYKFITTRPQSYQIPEDGPVGDMLRMQKRHAWRPAHIHYKVTAEGFEPLITAIYADDDPYLEEDAVFGVRESLIVPFRMIDSKEEAEKNKIPSPFCSVEFDFTLKSIQ